jgi:thiol-disulfide isomerase/thioredoxin
VQLVTTTDPTLKPRRHFLLRWLRELAVTALLALIVLQVVGWLRAPDLPDQAPDFTLPALAGDSVTLSNLRGQTVVLNFWATWCGPCRIEIPGFSAFADANPDIVVLGVATDGTRSQLMAARKKLEISYPVVRSDRETTDAYGVQTLPTTVIVGPDGSVQAVHTGILTRPQLWWMTRGW